MSDSSTASVDRKLPRDLASEKGLVNVQIDGRWLQVAKGIRIIEACRQAGTIVPHYCYHPKLSSPGSCRMCLVQTGMPPRPLPGQDAPLDEDGYQPIQWLPRPVIACANTVSENMGIRTKGPLIEECRRGVMEFLLINHPLDCPICDQAGECRLQELSVGYGRGDSRFVEMKIKKPKNVDVGPRIRLDDERCILCGRCVRFMEEIAGDPVLGFTQRGSHTTLSVHPGRLLDSNYSLNTVDLCPVGALTSNDFRFQMRVWFLKETPSIDVNCGTGCNITIWSRGNRIYRITPRQNDEVNSWWMPDSHRLNFHYIDSDQRLAEPLVRAKSSGSARLQCADPGILPGSASAPDRDAGAHSPAPWPDALAATASGLRGIPAGRLAVVASARMTNEELWLAGKLALTLGARHALVPRHGEPDGLLIAADRNPNSTGARLVWKNNDPAADLDAIRNGVRDGSIKALLVLGEDLTEAAGFTPGDLAGLDFLATTQILANPTADAADVVLPAAAFAEKRGTMVNIAGRIQRLNAATTPPGQARDDWEILRDLLAALDATPEAPLNLIEDVFRQLASEVPEFSGLTHSKIGDQGLPVTDTGVTIPLLEGGVGS